ncbi:alpha-galactosidase [Enterococcus sp. JM4C]|uniref:glycoside hydrolase family 36 protein n=1 Tax=Candidatus Enterococcus huntleyi TaxID=1857217 RepID=UPI001379D9CB|nr:glycoside hydrolase family 36 protein [Enterococcus sp. JM4C]KAF1297395.1 alpha-galactosidase [Enterococcus sp. JM4C]
MKIEINENGLYAVLEITKEKDIRLLHLADCPYDAQPIGDEELENNQRLVEVKFSGENAVKHHGPRQVGTLPGYRLEYQNYTESENQFGKYIEFHLTDPETLAAVTVCWQFYTGVKALRTWTRVENRGTNVIGMEHISSFYLANIDAQGLKPRNEKLRIHMPHSSWSNEGMWKNYSFEELGFYSNEIASSKRIFGSNTGTWSSHELAPMAILENTEANAYTAWQIENQGSWNWEISGVKKLMYLQLSGPNDRQNHWYKELEAGESFETVPTAIAFAHGKLDDVLKELTNYRRKIRRPNKDNQTLGVIFNDYMNCLFGDPTTEKELPLIDAAAEIGCEYYCVDAGWYSAGEWWDGVGEWQPSFERFPNGIQEVTSYIKEKGMIPGLWLEIEVMGINSPLAKTTPKDWFFHRHGKPVIDRSRYQLDFRNPDVQTFADEIISRVVEEYGVGYIKMDYNIDAGAGTDLDSDSLGDGLLEHNRAYLTWLDRQFEKYPDLIIESCSSGGMREDYALLSRHSLQSTSDQENYLMTGAIAANASSLMTPEQAAVWSYPLRTGDINEVVFNMANAMLLRIHQSGHLVEISDERKAIVKEAIQTYKEELRQYIPISNPVYPLNTFANFEDEWFSFGWQAEGKTYFAVWKKEPTNHSITLDFSALKNKEINLNLVFPKKWDYQSSWNKTKGQLSLSFNGTNTARIFCIVGCD